MHRQSFDRPGTPFVQSRSFTLSTALAWLGHDCWGGCPDAASEWRAAVWFRRLPRERDPAGALTLVEVGFADGPGSGQLVDDLLRAVNSCVSRDRIRVDVRPPAPNGKR